VSLFLARGGASAGRTSGPRQLGDTLSQSSFRLTDAKRMERARREGADRVENAARGNATQIGSRHGVPPAGNLVGPVLSQLNPGGTLVMAPVSSSPTAIEDYSRNPRGRSITTLHNLKRSDVEDFFSIVNDLGMRVGTTGFPFEELQDALILVRRGELEQPNAVIREVRHRIREWRDNPKDRHGPRTNQRPQVMQYEPPVEAGSRGCDFTFDGRGHLASRSTKWLVGPVHVTGVARCPAQSGSGPHFTEATASEATAPSTLCTGHQPTSARL